MSTVRTDLAAESCIGSRLSGVSAASRESRGISITDITISEGEGERLSGKKAGRYLTFESEGVKQRDPQARADMAFVLGEEMLSLIPKGDKPVLIIGLGNRRVTPDALGPKTVEGTLVTRHLAGHMPESMSGRMEPVCALAPGVMGVTGIETVEVASAIAQSIDPRAVIVVDSLAARAVGRVGSTVQLSNTGIQPGSGVGNHRKALTQETLGVPVIALGVPMVIYAATIARDAFEQLSGEGGGPDQDARLDRLAEELLRGSMGEMIVTPREVDQLVDDAAAILAGGINHALQPMLDEEEIRLLMT